MATYYVDATLGNDGNLGTSSGAPWKTMGKVNGTSFSAGDSILFKCGETWTVPLTVPSSGSAGLPITFGSYSTGALPIIDGEPDLGDSYNGYWTVAGNWSVYSGNIWQKTHNSAVNPQQAYFNGTQYYMAASAGAVNSTNRWFWGSNVFYVYATSNPATFYTSMKIPTCGHGNYFANYSVSISSKNYVDLENIEFRGGAASVYMLTVNHCNVHDCTIGKSAGWGVVIAGVSTYVNVYDNLIDSDFHTAGTALSDTSWNGDGIYTKSDGDASYCNFYGNTVSDWCHSQICIKGYTDVGGTCYNNIYQNNLTGTNCNHGRGISLSQNSVANRVHHNNVYSNYIYDTSMANEFFGNNNNYYRNVIDTVRKDMYDTNAGGIAVWSTVSSTEHTQDNAIYNNVVYNVCSYGIQVYADATYSLTGISVYNNIIMNWGMGITDYGLKISTLGGTLGPNIYKNNLLYKSGVSNVVSYRGSLNTIAQFNAQSSDTVSNNLSADPLFINAAGHNFHLSAGSPCIDSGMDTGITSNIVSHTYASPGIYVVRLTVTDNNNNTTYVEKSVPVAHTTFTADFKDRTNIGIPLTVNFDGSFSYKPGGSITNYAWTFGDGTTGTGA